MAEKASYRLILPGFEGIRFLDEKEALALPPEALACVVPVTEQFLADWGFTAPTEGPDG